MSRVPAGTSTGLSSISCCIKPSGPYKHISQATYNRAMQHAAVKLYGLTHNLWGRDFACSRGAHPEGAHASFRLTGGARRWSHRGRKMTRGMLTTGAAPASSSLNRRNFCKFSLAKQCDKASLMHQHAGSVLSSFKCKS